MVREADAGPGQVCIQEAPGSSFALSCLSLCCKGSGKGGAGSLVLTLPLLSGLKCFVAFLSDTWVSTWLDSQIC